MEEEIYQGWDCCKSDGHPETPVRIYPATATVKPGSSLELKAKTIHKDCSDACYLWRHASGGGALTQDVGVTNTYTAPENNPGCTNSAVIHLICRGEVIHKACIATSDYAGLEMAAMIYSPTPVPQKAPAGRRLDYYYMSKIDCAGRVIVRQPYFTHSWPTTPAHTREYWLNQANNGGTRPLFYIDTYTINGKVVKPGPRYLPTNEVFDTRTPAMIDAECCIAQLMEECY